MQGDGVACRAARQEGSRTGQGLRAELRPLRFTTLALVAVALLAPPAAARPWHVRTVSTAGAGFSRGVDVIPNGRTVLLLQQRTGGANRLELRVGRRTRLLDKSAHPFLDPDIQHDGRGRLVVTWRRPLEGAGPAAFAWTAKGGRQQVSGIDKNVSFLSLSVGGSGRAAIAYWSESGVLVARRLP